MNEIPEEDSGQFKMRLDDDEIEDSVIASTVNDLRLEKLNQRMTLVSILIPVLIVVVLVMAYMDIKRRVVKTEDTGQMTAQTLSENLESRFSNLSMGQALIEEKINRFMDQTNQTVAKVQVNIKNLDDSLKTSTKRMASQKDVNAAAKKMGQDLGNVAQTVESINARIATLDDEFQARSDELQSRLTLIDRTITENKDADREVTERLQLVEQNKLDKAAVDLALKLEILKLKQDWKARMDDMASRFKILERKVDKLAARPAPRAKPPSAAPTPVPASPTSGGLKEQTIKQ